MRLTSSNNHSRIMKIVFKKIDNSLGELQAFFWPFIVSFLVAGVGFTQLVINKTEFSILDMPQTQFLTFISLGVIFTLLLSCGTYLFEDKRMYRRLSKTIKTREDIRYYKIGAIWGLTACIVLFVSGYVLSESSLLVSATYCLCGAITFATATFIYGRKKIKKKKIRMLLKLNFAVVSGFCGVLTMNLVAFI